MLPFPDLIRFIDQLTRDDLRALSDSYFLGLVLSSIVVGVGILLEAPEAIHTLIEVCKDVRFPGRKSKEPSKLVKACGVLGWLIVLTGVAGEGIFEWYAAKADGLVQSFNNIVLEADERDILSANQLAGRAADAAKTAEDAANGAIASAAEAERRISGVNQRAKEIDADVAEVEWIISARRIQDADGLANDLRKKYKGQRILLRSYAGDWEGYWLCSQLSDIAKRAEMLPQDECSGELAKNLPTTDIDVHAPTIPEAQALSMVLMGPKRVPGLMVNLHVDPVLTILVGVKSSWPIWPPHKRSPDPKTPTNSAQKKH